jgi:glucosylceramidase
LEGDAALHGSAADAGGDAIEGPTPLARAVRAAAGIAFVAFVLTSRSDTLGESMSPAVVAYVTSADASLLLARRVVEPMRAPRLGANGAVVSIDERRRFQTIDGFGAALTGSSAYLIARLPDGGAELLGELFGRDPGIGLSYLRVSIGASDFSLGSYSYDDVAEGRHDDGLAAFSVARDSDVLSVLTTIHARWPGVRFMAAPWTAPAWMKSNRSLFGGELRRDAYGAYARYFISYLRELRRRGIALDALSPQNEPLFASPSYPSMTMSASQEAEFVSSALGPALRAEFPATKLLVSDHNWGESYPLAVMRDAAADRYVDGAAFHCYGGSVAQMSAVRNAAPTKGVYVSECSGGAWSPVFRDNLSWDMRNLIVGATTNWARTVLLGNLALDDAAGPTNGGCMDCRGLVTVHADGTFSRNVEYYVLAHAAQFVRPGAVRIGSSSNVGPSFAQVAFLNPDGSNVLIAFNASRARMPFAVRRDGSAFRFALPAGAVATFVWP